MAPGATWPRMASRVEEEPDEEAEEAVARTGHRRAHGHVAPGAWVECGGSRTRPPREGDLITYPLYAPLYAQGACLRSLSLVQAPWGCTPFASWGSAFRSSNLNRRRDYRYFEQETLLRVICIGDIDRFE